MKTYLVGGAVRDALLGREVKDRDWVVVGATPTQMINQGYAQVGADFPVFLHPKTGEEYALARQERKVAPGYHGFESHCDPLVTLEDDLLRRDLTINAMAQDEDGNIIDPHGGQEDLDAGILRHVSDAFAEDPVRVLRVARFAARYSFKVAPTTIELMRKLVNDGELNHLTKERVWSEFSRAMMEPQPEWFFAVLSNIGALQILFPELMKHDLWKMFAPLNVMASFDASLEERLMVLFADMPEESVESFFERNGPPTSVQVMAERYRFVLNRVNNLNTVDLVMGILKPFAYKDPDAMYKICKAMVLVGHSDRYNPSDILLSYKLSADVSFASLTGKQRETLKGPEIGKAIDKLRADRIERALYM